MVDESKSVSTIPITIDDRERASGILSTLEAAGGFKVTVKRLAVGDYQVDNRFLVERKTFPDLIQAIITGRLFTQTARLAKKHILWPVLILEGTAKDLRKSEMSWEALQGALVTVSVFYGIPLLRSRRLEETVKTFKYLANQARAFKTGTIQRHAARPKGKKALQRHILQSLPGVGAKRADALLSRFETVEAVVTANESALASVSGIGLETARKIHWSIKEKVQEKYAF